MESTPPKNNRELEHDGLEDDSSFSRGENSQVPC